MDESSPGVLRLRKEHHWLRTSSTQLWSSWSFDELCSMASAGMTRAFILLKTSSRFVLFWKSSHSSSFNFCNRHDDNKLVESGRYLEGNKIMNQKSLSTKKRHKMEVESEFRSSSFRCQTVVGFQRDEHVWESRREPVQTVTSWVFVKTPKRKWAWWNVILTAYWRSTRVLARSGCRRWDSGRTSRDTPVEKMLTYVQK